MSTAEVNPHAFRATPMSAMPATPARVQLYHVDLRQDCARTIQTKSYTLLQPILLYLTTHKRHSNACTRPRTLSMCAHARNDSHGILHREVKEKTATKTAAR